MKVRNHEISLEQIISEFELLYEKNIPKNTLSKIIKILKQNFVEEKIVYINDMSEEFFFMQYKTFSKIDSIKIIYPKMVLIQFYRLVCLKYKEEFHKPLFNERFEIILSSKSIYKIIDNDYIPVFYNRNENPPSNDKFCIIPNPLTQKNTHNKNNKYIFIDLSSIKEPYKEDLREFIWKSKGEITSKLNFKNNLLHFIIQKEIYDVKIKELNKDSPVFTELFLHNFRVEIEIQYENPSTIKSILKIIRKFLIYHSKKYRITTSTLQPLSLKGLEKSEGGKPISDCDLKIIYNHFKKIESNYEFGKLFTIVFELFLLTNIRFGEILNLERNCIIPNQDDPEFVTIQYLSKTSKKEYVFQKIHSSIAKLIQDAINLTASFAKNSYLSRYIFIHPYKRTISNENTRLNFYKYFKDIIRDLANQLEHTDYKPNNTRHTFINNVYREGTQNDLSLLQMAAITGNSYKTAKKHYRDLNEVDLYVEALSEVTFADVNINGEILNSENDVSTKNRVKNDLGNCKAASCISDITECLLCKQFVTSLERIPVFENAIIQLNKQIEETSDIEIIQEISYEKKLLAKYLSELFKLQEGGKK